MSTATSRPAITVADYLSGEQQARHKHEYVEGVVYAMVGATNTHNTIATNATGIMHAQLAGKPCRVFNSDTKIRVRLSRGTRFYYPDAMVACRLNPPNDTFQDAPVVVIEVLSDSTRRTDENEKRDAYLSIDSLAIYLRVEPSEAAVSLDRRFEDGFRQESYAGLDAIVPLPEIGCELRLSELYEAVAFEAPPLDSADDSGSF